MNETLGHAVIFCILIYAAKKMADKYKESQVVSGNKQLIASTAFGVRG